MTSALFEKAFTVLRASRYGVAIVAAVFIAALLLYRSAFTHSGPIKPLQDTGCPPLSNVSGVLATGGDLQNTFEVIYHNREWGRAGGGSGTGSSLRATETARLVVEIVILRYGIASMIDAPCGAMKWMPLALRHISERVPCFSYLGVDVARPAIEAAVQRCDYPRAAFAVWDFVAAPVPAALGSYELVLCRDALQHLSLLVSATANHSLSAPFCRPCPAI
jgi:hypothetical protein